MGRRMVGAGRGRRLWRGLGGSRVGMGRKGISKVYMQWGKHHREYLIYL